MIRKNLAVSIKIDTTPGQVDMTEVIYLTPSSTEKSPTQRKSSHFARRSTYIGSPDTLSVPGMVPDTSMPFSLDQSMKTPSPAGPQSAYSSLSWPLSRPLSASSPSKDPEINLPHSSCTTLESLQKQFSDTIAERSRLIRKRAEIRLKKEECIRFDEDETQLEPHISQCSQKLQALQQKIQKEEHANRQRLESGEAQQYQDTTHRLEAAHKEMTRLLAQQDGLLREHKTLSMRFPT